MQIVTFELFTHHATVQPWAARRSSPGLNITNSNDSVPYTYEYYQGLDIICSHISEQSTTTYFNRLF